MFSELFNPRYRHPQRARAGIVGALQHGPCIFHVFNRSRWHRHVFSRLPVMVVPPFWQGGHLYWMMVLDLWRTCDFCFPLRRIRHAACFVCLTQMFLKKTLWDKMSQNKICNQSEAPCPSRFPSFLLRFLQRNEDTVSTSSWVFPVRGNREKRAVRLFEIIS